MSLADELAKLDALREKGVLTDDEFEKQKAKLLNAGSEPPSAAPEPATERPVPSAAAIVSSTSTSQEATNADSSKASAPAASSLLPKLLIIVLLLGAVGILIYVLLKPASEGESAERIPTNTAVTKNPELDFNKDLPPRPVLAAANHRSNLIKRMPTNAIATFTVDISKLNADKEFEKTLSAIQNLASKSQKGDKLGALLKVMPVSSVKKVACTIGKKQDTACLLRGSFRANKVAPILVDAMELTEGFETPTGGKVGWVKDDVALVTFDANTLILGMKNRVNTLVAALGGATESIGKSAILSKALSHVNSSAMIVFVGGEKGIGHGAASLNLEGQISLDAFAIALQAEAKKALSLLPMQFESMKEQIISEIQSRAAKVPQEGAAFVTPYFRIAKQLLENAKFQPINAGLKLTAKAKLPAGGLFGNSAIISSVGIPAFVKYQRRAKTTEAIDQLDKIYKGASVYYSTPMVDKTGQKLPCQFPKKQVCIPAGSPCDYPDNRYPANPSIWDTPTWSALAFQMNDSHYFKYCFDSEGTLNKANFYATAHADLDCDGTWSTFQRIAFGDENANFAECSLKGTPAMFVDNETE